MGSHDRSKFEAMGRAVGIPRTESPYFVPISLAYRSERMNPAHAARAVPLGDAGRGTDGGRGERAVAGEAEQRLAAGMEQLPRMQREVFLLRAQQGLEYDEIAAALGTTPGAARVHYLHAVRRLKEYMQ